MKMNSKIWEAAAFITEWHDRNENGFLWKIFGVPRVAIDCDEDGKDYEDEGPAHLLLGIDDGGIRRVDIVLDLGYGRTLDKDERLQIEQAAASAPADAAEILKKYLAGKRLTIAGERSAAKKRKAMRAGPSRRRSKLWPAIMSPSRMYARNSASLRELMSKQRRTLTQRELAQRRAAGQKSAAVNRKGPRRQVSLREDAANLLYAAKRNRGISVSEVIRRDVRLAD